MKNLTVCDAKKSVFLIIFLCLIVYLWDGCHPVKHPPLLKTNHKQKDKQHVTKLNLQLHLLDIQHLQAQITVIIVGSIPREQTYKKGIAWMQCKSLWMKVSAKCINVNVNVFEQDLNSSDVNVHLESWGHEG